MEIGDLNSDLYFKYANNIYIKKKGSTNEYIQFFDSEGNPAIQLKNVIKSSDPSGTNASDGIYYYNNKLYIKVGGNIIDLSLLESSLPKGSIIMYQGTSAPEGWSDYGGDTGISGVMYITNGNSTIKPLAVITKDPKPINGLKYNGNEQTLATEGTASGGTIHYSLSENGTYSLDIPKGKDISKYYIWYYVKADSEHRDSTKKYIECFIAKKDDVVLTSSMINITGTYTYNSEALTPTYTVKDGSTDLTKGKHFTESLSNNIKAGEATLTISAITNSGYTGSATKNFTINRKSLNSTDISIETIPDLTYNGGKEIKPTVVVKDGLSKTLTLDTDYTVAYLNNTSPSTEATVIITGKGNYEGEKQGKFTIKTNTATKTNPKGKTGLKYTGLAQDLIEPGSSSNGTFTYSTTLNGTYSSTIPQGTDAKSYTVYWKFEGKPGYSNDSGSITSISIAKADITPTVSITGWTEGGEASTPKVEGNSGNGAVTYLYKVKDAADSTYSSTKPTTAGEYTVKVTIAATANYNGGNATTNFTISKKEEEITKSFKRTSTKVMEEGGSGIDTDNLKIKIIDNRTNKNNIFTSITINYGEDGSGSWVNPNLLKLLVDETYVHKEDENDPNRITSYSSNATYKNDITVNSDGIEFIMNELDGKYLTNGWAVWGVGGDSIAISDTTYTADGNGIGVYGGPSFDSASDASKQFIKGKCYSITVSGSGNAGENNTARLTKTEDNGSSLVQSQSKIKVSIKNNIGEEIKLKKLKFSGSDWEFTKTFDSEITINSGKTHTTDEIDAKTYKDKQLTTITIIDSNNKEIAIPTESGSIINFDMGYVYNITLSKAGEQPQPIDEDIKISDDDIADYAWASNNYIMDTVIDSYFVHNWNIGKHTLETLGEEKADQLNIASGWLDYDDVKKEKLVNIAVVPDYSDLYVYGDPIYVEENGTETVTKEKGEVTFTRLAFKQTNDTSKYKIEGPFAGLDKYENTFNYLRIVLKIGDFASRNPIHQLNYGRVRPLGSINKNGGHRVQDDIGNIWNSIYHSGLTYMIYDNAGEGNSSDGIKVSDGSDINGDKATSYPSGHAALTWAVAMALALILGKDNSDTVKYVQNAYTIGVWRTIGRFHWNSDIMLGRLCATMVMPIINSIYDLKSLYSGACSELNSNGHDSALPTDSNYSSKFNTLLNKFTNVIGSVSENTKKYLWNIYSVAEAVLDPKNNHPFLSLTTYPEEFPLDGYTVTINGETKPMKYRGTTTEYYCGSKNLNIEREDIMQSWLMAMCLSELYCDLSLINEDHQNHSITDPNTDITTWFAAELGDDSETYDNQNTQTKLFALAYEIGGGRELDLYHEYRVDYDPTILRLAAGLVYATERGKYSFSTIRGLNNSNNGINLNITSPNPDNTNDALGCNADRDKKYYNVGYGVNTYYIFNDGPGPHSLAGIYDSNLKNPFETKPVGTSTLLSQHLDESLFVVGGNTPSGDKILYGRVNVTIVNNSGINFNGTDKARIEIGENVFDVSNYIDRLMMPYYWPTGASNHISISIALKDNSNQSDVTPNADGDAPCKFEYIEEFMNNQSITFNNAWFRANTDNSSEFIPNDGITFEKSDNVKFYIGDRMNVGNKDYGAFSNSNNKALVATISGENGIFKNGGNYIITITLL